MNKQKVNEKEELELLRDDKRFWFFLKKVNERLSIFFQHKLPNKMELDEVDEQVFREMYEWFSTTDLFSATDDHVSDELATTLTIFEEINNGTVVD